MRRWSSFTGGAEKAPELENLDIQVVGARQGSDLYTAICMREGQPNAGGCPASIRIRKPSQMIGEVPAKWAES